MGVVIYQSLIIYIFVLFYGIVARQVHINGNITEIIGSNRTKIVCNFTINTGDALTNVWILATNITLHDFENVAAFDEKFGSRLVPFGKVLFGNASLSPFTESVRNASMSFDDLNCKHSRLYMCKISVATVNKPVIVKESDEIGIYVQVPPSKPDNIILVNILTDYSFTASEDIKHSTAIQSTTVKSIETDTLSTLQTPTQNDTNPLKNSTLPIDDHNTKFSTPSNLEFYSSISYSATTSYTEQTTTKTQDRVEGDNITVVCTGNVGNPPAEHIFQKYRSGHSLSMTYKASETLISYTSENCSYYRTSNLTFQVTAADNNATIRCVVNSSIGEQDMYVETEPIEVYYEVSEPTITKNPNKSYYVVGEETSINLTCKGDGNPNPTYQWYKENDNMLIGSNESLTITDMNVTNSGIYTCNVSNTFNGDTHRNTKHVQIVIMNKDYTTRIIPEHSSTLADISTTQSSSIGSSSGVDKKEKKSEGNLGLVAGIVGAVVVVIVVIIVIIACRRWKNKSPTFKNVSNSFDDSKPKPVTEPRTGDYDYIALEDDPPKSSNNGLEVEDINKHNAEYLKKQEEEEKKKNESITPPQPAVYAQVNEATKSKNKLKTETQENTDKQEEDTYAESQEGIYDKAGDRRHIENENVEHFDSSTNSSKQNSNGDSKQAFQTSQVGSYANQGLEKDEHRKVATVSPTVRSSGGSQNDEQTNSNRNSQSKKGYENIIGTEQTGISEDDSSHRTAL